MLSAGRASGRSWRRPGRHTASLGHVKLSEEALDAVLTLREETEPIENDDHQWLAD